ncbi:unnamed protein product [Symbiodinium natans]|uniref:T4 RNA ligase 1-like N-terminal domain-containing protein n=1 Tax=Symbiodinium natans TaxID=878477 RepID=A0A812PI49_9DINO|nr:unnamed protein product [Symbiodinium natans]
MARTKIHLVSVAREALASGVSATAENFRLCVPKFSKWLKSSEGKRFEARGKGYDDGVYLTSALLRKFLPRGYTHFCFSKDGEEVNVVLRGFFKFTGLTVADEDEESNVTAEAHSFLFHGYNMEDAQRFCVTTKSNGENGKYTFRKIFGDWYAFAGSKNTGNTWKLGADVSSLYPIPDLDPIAGVGPRIISYVDRTVSEMPDAARESFLEMVNQSQVTVMVEQNEERHEHIFPIQKSWVDHVAILTSEGFPWSQHEAFEVFDRYGLRRVALEICTDMSKLSSSMDDIRNSTDTEGAVLYLERLDGVAVGLIKVKSDHYVIARRTREILRGLVKASEGRKPLELELEKTKGKLREGMKTLTHVAGCAEHHQEWSKRAEDFASSWVGTFQASDDVTRRALVTEFHMKFGSLYHRFLASQKVLPLSDFSLEVARAAAPRRGGPLPSEEDPDSPQHGPSDGESAGEGKGQGKGKGKGKGKSKGKSWWRRPRRS